MASSQQQHQPPISSVRLGRLLASIDSAATEAKKVEFRVRCGVANSDFDGQEIFFRLFTTAQMASMMELLPSRMMQQQQQHDDDNSNSNQHTLEPHQIIYRFKDKLVSATDTPESLGIVDGDTIIATTLDEQQQQE
jgi:hypothetical protein